MLSTKEQDSLLGRMKPRCLLSTVDRLPTISEMQESDTEDGDLCWSSHTMEEYVDSIKELSQPAPYPRHGPLRGHRRWMLRTGPGVTSVASPFPNSSRSYASWIPVELSDVSVTLIDQSNCDTSLNFMDQLPAQSLFAGLVWARVGQVPLMTGFTQFSLQPAATSVPYCMIYLCLRSNWV